MKRIIVFLVALMLLSACSRKDPPQETTPDTDITEYPSYFSYPPTEVRCFAVDKNGIVYVAGFEPFSEDEIICPVSSYGLDGQMLAEYSFKSYGSILNMCASDDKLYLVSYALTDNKSIKALYSFDLNTQELVLLQPLDRFPDAFSIKKIAYLNGCVYILADDPAYADGSYNLWEGDWWESMSYTYNGTVLACYDIKEGSLETVFDAEPHNFALTSDEKIMLYAHDGEGGFYFAELDPATGYTLGEKAYRSFRNISSFAMDGDGVVLPIWSSSALCYNSLAEDTGAIEIVPNVLLYDDIVSYNGFAFYFNQSSQKIERIKIEAFINNNPQIRMIQCVDYGVNIFAEGYSIVKNELAYDEFALTVLSRDTSYDICYLGSRQDFATNIKEKGSFYPLNDVQGVQEYLDACFPYMKEAATDNNGIIWMIPVNVSVDAITYHKENCDQEEIYFANTLTIDEIIANVEKAREIDNKGSNYYFSGYDLVRKSLLKYMRNNTSLDTLGFRKMADTLKAFAAEDLFWGDSLASYSSDYDVSFNPDFLFDTVSQKNAHITERNDLYVAPLTGTDGTPNSADCVFLCVNPDSNNLSATLDYITAVCTYLMTLKDSFMLADPATYTDSDYARRLYALYENSVIDFNISDEVFANDFDRYLQGEIDLDTMITEADRKLAMYRGE